MEEDRQGVSDSLYSEKLLEHFRSPRRAGALDGASADIRVENPACGDRLRLTAKVESGVVTEAAFQAQGCTASIGCGSALADWLMGRSVAELRAMPAAAIAAAVVEEVDGLPEASRHAAALCADGVRALLAKLG